MEECHHGLEYGCTYCSGKETTLKAPVIPATPWVNPPAPVDHEAVLAARIAAGEVCGSCLTDHAPIGCDCLRKERYDEANQEAQAWIAAELEAGSFDTLPNPGKFAAGIAFGAQKRSGRRAGLTADDHQADRLDIIDRFEVDPKWRKFSRTEADFLPV